MVDGDEQLEGFRREVRAWCRAHVPSDWRERLSGVGHEEYVSFQRWWREELRAGGYLAPHWPEAWGGGGLGTPEQVVLYEELARADAPRLGLYQVALFNAAPAILDAGTAEQKRRFLPGILDGQVWCQGFSEPNAGSDLAALRTRAERDGDRYVVTGQKVWTSHAGEADWCILLARTDPEAPKHEGISYLLLDMRAPGVEVRPIRQVTGASGFSELFLDGVLVPVEHRLGAENAGWRVAMSTLASERAVVMVELVERFRHNGLGAVIEDAASWALDDGTPALDDAGLREGLASRHARAVVLRLLCNRLLDDVMHRGGTGPEASIIKVLYSELLQDLMDLVVRARGLPAQEERPLAMGAGWETGHALHDFLNSWSWTIAGGTNEIQRNILGERFLGLPREGSRGAARGAAAGAGRDEAGRGERAADRRPA